MVEGPSNAGNATPDDSIPSKPPGPHSHPSPLDDDNNSVLIISMTLMTIMEKMPVACRT
jgi:hypothetical protein